MLDPYTILQVARGATSDEIKRAYRRLAKELHPDLNPGNPNSARRFKDLNAAYDVLSDDAKRRQYDLEVAAAAAAAERRAQARNNNFDESLDSFFGNRSSAGRGGAGGGGPRRRGADIYQSVRIPFVEAALGARKRLAISEDRTLDMQIPPLTQDGQSLRLKGQGGDGQNGGPNGDVFVEITVEPHPVFTRRELDIHMTLPVSIVEAVMGASVQVPTVHGPVQIKIPKGSNTDTVLRLRGKGLTAGGLSPVGDQYVTLKTVLPSAKDTGFTQIIEQWAKKNSYSVRP